MSTWYRIGTAAFTNGNATVIGTGTAWISNASVGEGLIAPDGRIYEITAIASDTSLTISPAYLGSTASGQAYAIAPIRGRIAQLLSETSSLLASFATVRDGIGSGMFPNGTVSAPALRAAADQDTGLFFPAANNMALATGGVERARVNSTGLGIGTSSPAAKLHIEAGTNAVNTLFTGAGSSFNLRVSSGDASVINSTVYSLNLERSGSINAAIDFRRGDFGVDGELGFIANGSERMRLDAAGNVGIGTTTPGARLDVAAGGTSARIRITDSDSLAADGTMFLEFAGTNARAAYLGVSAGAFVIDGEALSRMSFNIGGSERVRFASNGNVGIGTTTPFERLTVDTGGTGVAGHSVISSGGIARLRFGYNPGTAFKAIDTAAEVASDGTGNLNLSSRGNVNNAAIRFFTSSDGLSSAERFRITSGGNVGIGTSSPGELLEVRSANDAAVKVAKSGQTAGYFQALSSGVLNIEAEGGVNPSAITFQTGPAGAGNPTERMRINSAGNVGIGTSSPGARLETSVTATGATAEVLRLNNPGVGANTRAQINFVAAATSYGTITGGFGPAAPEMVFNLPAVSGGNYIWQISGTERMRIDNAGDVGIGTANPAGWRLRVEKGDANHILLLNTVGNGSRISMADQAWNAEIEQNAGNLLFKTGGTTERMRIDSGGIVRPGADNTQSLGEASFRWSTVFAGTGTINTSDEREKVWRGAMTEAEMRAAKRLLGELGMFQFTDSVEEKGEDARLHFGVRAQRAFAILEDEGLEWGRYAWCCHDEWDEITEPVMEEVTVEKTRTVEVPEEREVEKTETVMEPVIDEETGEQVFDENEQPVMVEVERTFTVTETVMVEVEETYEETEQRDTGEVRVVREAGDRYGIRADQLAYWLIAAQAEIQSDLDARLAKLEAKK